MSSLNSVAEATQDWAKQRQIETVYKNETGSTNDDAKTQALNETEAAVLYLSGHQTAGRGRGGNTWLDTGNGECLLSTWSFETPKSPQAITAPRIGLALYRAVTSVWPSLDWSLKAPNDLFLGGRKVGGLLVETVSSGTNFRLLIGLGLNILNHPRRFDEAEHLSKTLDSSPDVGEWFQFLDELLKEWEDALKECVLSELSQTATAELTSALNANSAKPFTVTEVTRQGDLIHSNGHIKWTEL